MRNSFSVVLIGTHLVWLLLIAAIPAAHAEVDLDSAAAHFGQQPAVWGMRLSPDGQKVSFLRLHPDGFPIAMIIDLKTGKGNLVLASDPKKGVDITSCEWANATRLLCKYFGTWKYLGDALPATRLVAADIDGKNIKVLVQRQQKKSDEFALNQSEIIDRLPDDPKHIWLQLRKDNGKGVSQVDIYKNRIKTVERARDGVWGHYSDGRGELRLRTNQDRSWVDYEYRLAGETRWKKLKRYQPSDDNNAYQPATITPGSNELFVWDWHKGRIALFKESLSEDALAPRKRELVKAHDEVDLSWIVGIGKFGRPVGVGYRTDKTHIDYFDEDIIKLEQQITPALPGQNIWFIDESWDRRFYLVHASSDIEPGAYYRYDTETDELSLVTNTYPWLEDVDLAEMKPLQFASTDGASIPGYLTRPLHVEGPAPLIVFPHGGPSSRDDWGYDRLPQFFASRGYAVLQPNYRGSAGYGKKWKGKGGFKAWKTVASDIEAGVAHLVAEGLVDPDRICAVGWSFGGYAALISALQSPARYQCVVSIAGVSHPHQLIKDLWRYSSLQKRFTRKLIPEDPENIVQGSPLRRAAELNVPVLLFHGDMDLNVNVDHSRVLEKALSKAEKSVEYIEYEGAAHSITKQSNRIDMLQRMGDFLDKHLAKKTP